MKRTSLSHTFLILLLVTSGLTACGLVQRHPDSGYYSSGMESYTWTSERLQQEKRSYEADMAKEELGIETSRPLSEVEAIALENRLALNRLESKIETEAEKKQYYRYRGLMESDPERIHFLRLPTLEARERWASNKGYNAEVDGYPDEIATLIEENNVAVGMSQKAVMESWGDPDAVEVAGNSVYGNERWRYSRYVSSNEGYQKIEKVLYFESGRLVGWETF